MGLIVVRNSDSDACKQKRRKPHCASTQSAAEQAGLILIWLKTLRQDFSRRGRLKLEGGEGRGGERMGWCRRGVGICQKYR